MKGHKHMAQMRRLSAFGLAAILLTFSMAAVAQSAPGRPYAKKGWGQPAGHQPAGPALSEEALAIQDKLLSQIKLTRATADRTDIVTAGDIVVLNKDGLTMCNSDSGSAGFNTYDNGVLTAIQQNAAGNPNADVNSAVTQAVAGAAFKQLFGSIGGGIASSAFNSAQSAQAAQAQAAQAKSACTPRQFVAGEKFWVTGITAQPDGILISTLSDPYSDVRYYGNIKFFFPPSATAAPYNGRGKRAPMGPPRDAPPVDDFLMTVAELISVVPPEDTNNQGSPADQGAQPAAVTAAPTPAAPALAPLAPLTDIAPPPPPADTPPPTISLGETQDMVTAAFGQPMKAVKLGVKEIFYYRDMKVIFTNGKVSNVE
jgi:hypothetical protein